MLTPRDYAGNPVLTSIFTADPSAHVWEDGRIYIYASHDMDPPRGCDMMDRYHVFSSDNMVDWRDEGEILAAADLKWGRPEGGFMWAPDAAYKNGTYYFYYPHPSGSDWNNTWKMGVASSKHPAKDFIDHGPIEGMGGFALIDPCVLTDDDGRAYIYYGGGARCFGGELNDDMVSLKTPMAPMEGLDDFHEAAWVFKRGGIYYLTYSDNNHGANNMKYCQSRNPLGPWEYKGIFLTPTGCDTSHGSVVEYKGQWYMFYHNQELSGQGNLRSVCIDKLEFESDGSMKVVQQTKTGVARVGEPATLNAGSKKYDITSGKVIAESQSGGRATLWIDYETSDRLAKMNLKVNGTDYTLINFPGHTPHTYITVKLTPGANTIQLTPSTGTVALKSLTVEPLD